MKWNSTFSTPSIKQKPPSVRKVCTLRPQEAITGQYTKSIMRHFDTYGRNVGYSIDSSRQNTLSYDPATGRMIGMNVTEGDFTWDYLANTNLKSKLTYPNGATAEWTYEPKRNVLTCVTNSLRLSASVINPQVISQYDYTNDAIARRTAMSKSGIMMAEADTIDYGYNARNEVIFVDAVQDADYLFNYTFDDIGNRITGENKAYTANTLNQYTAIGSFTPTYDANGNQTLVQTTTGTWTVAYNGENRPITWTKGDTVITMIYDRMGRRISYKKMQGDTLASHTKFLYKGYLCVQQLSADTPWNVLKAFVWDPTEPIATRPLVFIEDEQISFYMHDGNKNVTDVISSTSLSSDVTHYDYAPFGAVTRTVTATVSTQNSSPITHNSAQSAAANPFRFSSEYHDDDLGLVYYNYRHYNPTDGRWINRDSIEELGGLNLYGFVNNNPYYSIDYNGKFVICATLATFATITISKWVVTGVYVAVYVGVTYVETKYERTITEMTIAVTYAAICGSCAETGRTTETITEKETETKREKTRCKPCTPPVGTVRFNHYDPPGGPKHQGISTPHSHWDMMHQSPKTCLCYWTDDLVEKGNTTPKNWIPDRRSPVSQNGGGFADGKGPTTPLSL